MRMAFLKRWYFFVDVAFILFVVCRVIYLLVGKCGVARGGGLFVYTCFIDVGIECVNDDLESILIKFLFCGGH